MQRCTAMPRMPHSTDDLQAIVDELRAALVHGDANALDALLDGEFQLTSRAPAGLDGRDELIAAVRSDKLRTQPAEIERERLRVLGELATTDTIASCSGTYEGAPWGARLRIRATWRLDGDWSLISADLRPATRQP